MKKIKGIGLALAAILMTFLVPVGALADTQPTGSTAQILVSNESVNGNQSESSDSFRLNNERYVLDKELNHKDYQLDYVKPFNPEKNGDHLLKNRMLTRSVRASEQIGDSRNFWVSNLETNAYTQLNFRLDYSGTHANVWVANDQISSDDADKLGDQFDSSIYSSDVDNFGNPLDVDGNGKINILCFDIQDGFDKSGGYVAGYFDPNDLTNGTDSNHSEILYMDTYPAMGTGSTKDVTEAYPTMAHEFQHLINFSQNVLAEGHSPMDTWMDEGLAMAAEQVYTGAPLQDEIDYYNADSAISDGQSLLYWDDDGDTLANYALSYLFMEYLRIQSGQGNQIYKQLIDDPNSNYKAVQDLIHKYINPNLSFGQFMTDFRLALYYNSPIGLYGFHGESGFTNIVRKIYNGSSVNLRGGGAVVMSAKSLAIPNDAGLNLAFYNLSDSNGPTQIVRTTAPLERNQIKVTNNRGKSDKIYIKNLSPGDVVKAYNSGKHLLASGTSSGSTLILTVKQLGTKSGKIYLTYTHPSWIPSSETAISFSGEVSGTLSRSQIQIRNYRHKRDTVTVRRIKKGDYIRIYNSKKKIIAKKHAGHASLTFSFRQLGKRGGHIYATVTHAHMRESAKRYAGFGRER
ncbi:hypothetical protein ACFP7A_04835 [Sporolactobacillus kofuensis]|uniref:Peptidase M30, hyicolysin n=1 Tax=Sporolactobacillus kofuensis TaxID=269672 RepID=A0ABW1WBG0_9BACL|nr:hypothetical protein [Sporolactobacillus kofuensis]MCO7174830.1 hypothetical protein [Sporolactobacillus kofuensis]